MNLSNYSTFIVDAKPTSEYFRISDFNETLSGGKNGFLIEGSEHLKETTEIKIEILDVEGNPIYFEPGNGIPEYYEGISKLISVHVYDDTPIGVGKITILGELKNYIGQDGIITPVPSEWKNTYNVKWEKTFTINKNLPNEDIVRFYKRPIISIDEIVKPIFSKVTPSVTQSGSLQGISQTPIDGTNLTNWRAGTIYKLKITDDGNFTSSIDENVINIPSLGYSPTVKEVLNNKEVLVDIPYSINNIVSNFDSVGYTSSFEYVEGQTVSDSSLTGSFAKINIQQLKTFVGDVARVKIYRKSRNEVGDFQFVQESKLEASELLRDVTTTSDTEVSYGNFTDSNLSTYWVSSSNDHPITIDVEKLNAAVKVDYNTTLGGVQQLITSESFSVSKDVEYTISFKTLLSGSLDGSKTIKAYLSSSDYQQTFLTVSGSDIYKTRQTVSQNILATNTTDAKLVFEFEGGDWYVSNVSLQNAQETSFSPDEFVLIQDVPRKLASETFDYRFEFYDINNNYIPVDVLGTHTFTGGNSFPTNNKLLTFESDRTAFRFSTGSVQNPPNQQIKFTLTQNNLTGSVTYASSAFDVQGNFLNPNEYSKYPGELTSVTPAGAVLTVNNFTGSRVDGLQSPFVGSIVYTASVDDLVEYETVYRLEDGENAPGLFVTSDANQFIYKATDLSPNPSNQTITVLAKRKNLASSTTPIIVNGVGNSPSLTELGTNQSTGITSYSLDILDFNYSIPAPSASYFFTASDEWGNLQYDTVTISQVKVLDGLSVSLTNENATLSALSTGFVPSGSFVFTSGSVSVKVGSEDITRQEGLSTNNRWDIISAVGISCTPNDATPDDATYGITSLSADSASLQLVVRYKDGGGDTTDVTKVVTYSKAKKSAPLLNFAIGNGNQTVTAKSTGAQIDSFANVSFAVNETYNGLTSTKTFTPTSITATNGYSGWSANSTTLTLPNMANGTDSVDLSITGSVVDSENTTRLVYGNVSLAKTKKAVPNVVLSATPQSQTVSANPAGAQTGTLSNVSVTAVEGSTSRFTSMVISGTSGFSTAPTVSGSTLTMTSAVMNSDEASVTLTVTHNDSEGTTGQTKTIIIRASKIKQGESGVVVNISPATQVVSLNISNQYANSKTFTVSVVEGSTTYTYDGTTPYAASTFRIDNLTQTNTSETPSNSNGVITPGKVNNTAGSVVSFNIIYTNSSGTPVTIPSTHSISVSLDGQTGPGVVSTGPWEVGRAYQFSTGGIAPGQGRRDVVLYPASGAGIYYATTQQHTSTASGVTGPPTVGTYWESLGPQDYFVAAKIGLFEDSYVQSTLNIGTNSTTGFSTANITLSGGTAYPYFSLGQSSAGVYNATGIFIGAVNDSGTKYKLSLKGTGGSLTWDGNNLNIVGGGTFSGALSAATGTFNGSVSIGSGNSIFKADTNGIYLGNATFADAPFRVTPAGALTSTSGAIGGWNIDSNSIYSGTKDVTEYSTTGITLSSGGSIHSPNFYINTAGGAFFKGNITGGSIDIGSGKFYVGTDGTLTATGANINGTITAQQGNIGGWGINSDGFSFSFTDSNGLARGVKINSARGAVELSTGGQVSVDINSNPYLTNLSSGTAVLSGVQLVIGSGTLSGNGTPKYSTTSTTTMTLTAGVTYQFIQNAGNGPNIAVNGDQYNYAQWGVLISQNSTPTVDNSAIQLVGGGSRYTAGNILILQTTGNFTPSTSGTYYIRSFVSLNSYEYTYIGGTSYGNPYVTEVIDGSLSGDYYISNISISPSTQKTEVVGGGIQVVKDIDTFFKIDRNANGSEEDFVYGSGASFRFEGSSGANANANKFRLNNFQNINMKAGGHEIVMGGGDTYMAIYPKGGIRISPAIATGNGSTDSYIHLEPGSGNYAVVGNSVTNVNLRIKIADGTNPSDERLKTEIQLLSDGALSKINEIDLKTYKYIDTKSEEAVGYTKVGVIAQDIQKTSLKNLVIEQSGGDLYVDYDSLLGYAMKAIQELSTKLNELEAKISGSM